MLCTVRTRMIVGTRHRVVAPACLRASLVTVAGLPGTTPSPARTARGWWKVGAVAGCAGLGVGLGLVWRERGVPEVEASHHHHDDNLRLVETEERVDEPSVVVCIARTVQVFLVFIPASLTLPFSLLHPSLYRVWLQLLVRTLEAAGPAFIKLGQWASTRPDVFSPAACNALGVLHDSVCVMPTATAMAALRSEVGDLDRVFASVDPVPIGSGCIAQVHAGVLRETQERVAVKIRRPHVRQAIHRDLHILGRLAALADAVPALRPMRLPEIVDNFAAFMSGQLSFLREADNLQQFSRNFAKTNACEGIGFPRPVMEHTSEGVLVESFQPGVTLSTVLRNQAQFSRPVLKTIGERILNAFMQMVFVDNLVHADMHPGNILVDPHDHEAAISVVDAGLVVSLQREDRDNFVDLVATVAKGDGGKAAELIIRRGGNEGRVVNPEGFIEGMQAIVGGVSETTFQLSKVKIGDVLSRVLHLVRHHKVHLDPVFANLVVSIVVLEGVGRQINPDLDLFALMVPLLPRAHRDYIRGAAPLVLR